MTHVSLHTAGNMWAWNYILQLISYSIRDMPSFYAYYTSASTLCVYTQGVVKLRKSGWEVFPDAVPFRITVNTATYTG